jgi:hypothetical protein
MTAKASASPLPTGSPAVDLSPEISQRFHVHDQLGRRSRLPVPGIHAGCVSVIAEVIDFIAGDGRRLGVRLEGVDCPEKR